MDARGWEAHRRKLCTDLRRRYFFGDHSAVWNGQPEAFEAELKAFWEASLRHQNA